MRRRDPEQIDVQQVPVAKTHKSCEQRPVVSTNRQTHMLEVVGSGGGLVEHVQTFHNLFPEDIAILDCNSVGALAHRVPSAFAASAYTVAQRPPQPSYVRV